MATNLEQAVETATQEVKKVVKRGRPAGNAKVATKVEGVITEKKAVVKKAIKAETKKATAAAKEVKKEVKKVASKINAMADASTFSKVIATGKKTTKILSAAGEVLLNNSIKSTKAIAGIYSKAGKKALAIGKDVMNETSKVMFENQKVMKSASIKAFKQTVETIQDSNIVEFPFKKK